MYAIITSGGKQFKVEKDQTIRVEKLESAKGDVIELDVNMICRDDGTVAVGTPVVQGATCKAEVVGYGKAKKVIVYKYKSKKNERKRQGHRQPFTALKITEING